MPKTLLDVMTRLKRKELNLLRSKFEQSSEAAVCYLLRLDGDTQEYTETFEATADFYWDFDSYRNQTYLMFAASPGADSDAFELALRKSSHFSIYGYVYQIVEADVVPPFGEEPFWRIPGELLNSKKYVSA